MLVCYIINPIYFGSSTYYCSDVSKASITHVVILPVAVDVRGSVRGISSVSEFCRHPQLCLPFAYSRLDNLFRLLLESYFYGGRLAPPNKNLSRSSDTVGHLDICRKKTSHQ